ncbi:hypothetical protein [Pedobacter paludis]|uniref:TerB family tellurite resistance protein n=1 Tax=Pedobacter paludis TaxID=2203212 RepID=A0A317F732_9SPHI|nr:hypothetical protein [Pedobacter paludis]PWS33328.1 hypothetical protein DF947_01500 [Pedobacter paludis]
MKLIRCIMLVFGLSFGLYFPGFGQSTEAQQLLLNVEKLSQLKNILSDMKKGYEVLSTGYNSVRNIARGNFSLHEVFLDGLWLVSPEVRKYYKIAEIVSMESDLVREYKSAFSRFSSSGSFSVSELEYFGAVYGKLVSESLDGLEELLMIVTDSKLRMSDHERLAGIDRVFAAMQERLTFLRSFNRKNSILQVQRLREQQELKGLGAYFKIY